jgi:hypothetical protein
MPAPLPRIASLRTAVQVLVCLGLPAFIAPARAAPAFELQGKGVQIYTCTDGQGGFAWRLKAPDATLTNAQGTEVGHHFAGPSWQGKDGSLVTGEVETAASGGAGAIPWLVLRAKTHAGEGLFASVKAIVRSRTQGGVAPPTGCDASHGGAETQVPYTAEYSFFPE